MTRPDTAQEPPEPPRLRALRRLVTALTVTLMLGIIIIVGLMVWRLGLSGPSVRLPEEIALPEGERLTGWAQNAENLVLITEDGAGVQRVHLAGCDGQISRSATFTQN